MPVDSLSLRCRSGRCLTVTQRTPPSTAVGNYGNTSRHTRDEYLSLVCAEVPVILPALTARRGGQISHSQKLQQHPLAAPRPPSRSQVSPGNPSRLACRNHRNRSHHGGQCILSATHTLPFCLGPLRPPLSVLEWGPGVVILAHPPSLAPCVDCD